MKKETVDFKEMNGYFMHPDGVVDSGYSENDFDIELVIDRATKLTDKYINPEFQPKTSINKIESQKFGSCVNHGGSSTNELVYLKAFGKRVELSNTYNYLCTREEDHWQKEGMIPREFHSSQKKYGTPELKYFDEKSDYISWKKSGKQPSKKAVENAKKYRVKAYFRIDPDDTEAIKLAIMQFGAVGMSFQLKTTFNKGKEKGLVPMPQSNDPDWGGHYMYCVGWDEYDRWGDPNSWTDQWGDNGIAWIPIAYKAKEVWAVSYIDVDFIVVSKMFNKTENKNFAKWVDKHNPQGVDDAVIKGKHYALAGTFSDWEEAKARRDEINNHEGIGVFKKSFIIQAVVKGTDIKPIPGPEPQPEPKPSNSLIKEHNICLTYNKNILEFVEKKCVRLAKKKLGIDIGKEIVYYLKSNGRKYKKILLFATDDVDKALELKNLLKKEKPYGKYIKRYEKSKLEELDD